LISELSSPGAAKVVVATDNQERRVLSKCMECVRSKKVKNKCMNVPERDAGMYVSLHGRAIEKAESCSCPAREDSDICRCSDAAPISYALEYAMPLCHCQRSIDEHAGGYRQCYSLS
jgi:hypothetical protein